MPNSVVQLFALRIQYKYEKDNTTFKICCVPVDCLRTFPDMAISLRRLLRLAVKRLLHSLRLIYLSRWKEKIILLGTRFMSHKEQTSLLGLLFQKDVRLELQFNSLILRLQLENIQTGKIVLYSIRLKNFPLYSPWDLIIKIIFKKIKGFLKMCCHFQFGY